MIRNFARTATGLGLLAALGACEAAPGTGDGNGTQAARAAPGHFVNDRAHARSDALRTNYVDFAFDYPAGWSESPQGDNGNAQNFVRVAAPMQNGLEPFAFHVGFASGSGNPARDQASIAATARDLANSFGSSLPNYVLVSVGPQRAGRYNSYGWRFTASVELAPGQPAIPVYGRGDIILPAGQTRGVTLITLATGRTDEVHAASEVGENGTLKALLDSFVLRGADGQPIAADPGHRTAARASTPPSTPAPATPHPGATAPAAAPATHTPRPTPVIATPAAPISRPNSPTPTPATPTPTPVAPPHPAVSTPAPTPAPAPPSAPRPNPTANGQ